MTPLSARISRARAFRSIMARAINVDLTARCNLRCRGCLYFAAAGLPREENDLASWQAFFAARAAEGVAFASFAGAEPALVQDRLAVAARYIRRGVVYSNGTVRIRADLPYAIVISLWGGRAETHRTRGADIFEKSFRLFRADPRARFLFTVHRNNIDDVLAVARICALEGVRLGFNYFSGTATSDGLALDPASAARAGAAVRAAIEAHPGTVFQSHALNRRLTAADAGHRLAGGIAIECRGRNSAVHRTYRADLAESHAKCCTPEVDCASCRLAPAALATALFENAGGVDWLDLAENFGRLNLLDDDPLWRSEPIGDRPLALADAAAVLSDPCAVHAGEMAAHPGVSIGQRLSAIAAGLDGGAGAGVAIVSGGAALAMVYHQIAAPGRRRIAFIARPRYFDLGLPAVRHARRHLADLERAYPGVRFEVRPGASGARIDKWLRTIGFEPDGAGFVSRSPTVDAAPSAVGCTIDPPAPEAAHV